MDDLVQTIRPTLQIEPVMKAKPLSNGGKEQREIELQKGEKMQIIASLLRENNKCEFITCQNCRGLVVYSTSSYLMMTLPYEVKMPSSARQDHGIADIVSIYFKY
ncbi:hypothetical protein TNCV_941981 [Trichonephila clavipes]|nr:hypothetical protein TNCV_941981 [Trichonephila clavipes]